MTPRIEVEIDELVLHGFHGSDRRTVAAALEAELARSLSGWRPDRSRTMAHVDAGAFDLRAGAPASSVGQAVASQIQGQLSRLSQHKGMA